MIRILKVEELEGCLTLAADFHSRTGIPGKFDRALFWRLWADLISNRTAFIVARDSGEEGIQEAIGVIVHPDVYSGDPTASVAFWMNWPGDKGLAAGLLYVGFIGECHRRGVKNLFVGALNNERFRIMDTFLVKAGFSLFEYKYRKAL